MVFLIINGYTVEQVKQWRTEQYDAGKPSSLEDFCKAHGLCFDCRALGKTVTGVRWRDSDGTEHACLLRPEENVTVASLYEAELKTAQKCAYMYTTCAICGGTGKTTG